MRWLIAATCLMLVVCGAGFSYSVGLIQVPRLPQFSTTIAPPLSYSHLYDAPLPLPPVPPPWHVVARYIDGGVSTLYQPDRRFDDAVECWLEVAKINARWRHEDRVGVATCRDE